MKLLQIHTFYPAYLDEFNSKNAKLASLTFDQQIAEIIKDGFSAGHMFAPYLKDFGYDTQLIIANWFMAQSKWLNENGFSNIDNMHEIVKLQVEKFRPDILYLSDPINFDSKFVRMLEWKPKLVIGWRAASIPEGTDWSELDLLISHMSYCREKGLELGAKHVEHFIPGHPKFITEALGSEGKKFDVVFSGQYSYEHTERNQFLVEVSKAAVSVKNFTPAFFLPASSTDRLPESISQFNHGAVWAREMYQTLKRGRIILNAHSDIGKKNEAGNMRLFETTGVGSFLLTDYKDNLSDYFQPGSEIETYKNTGELIDKINYYMAHPEEREAIALKGMERCLRDYSMEKRANDFDLLIGKYLELKNGVKGKSTLKTDNIINEALAKLNSDENEKAIALFDEAFLQSPELIGINFGKAIALARLDQKSASIKLLKDLLNVFPEHQKAKNLINALLEDLLEKIEKQLDAKQYKTAFNLIVEAKSLKVPVKNLDYLRAVYFLKVDQPYDAKGSLAEELRFFPGNTEAEKLFQQLEKELPTPSTVGISDPEFMEISNAVKPYTMVSEERLYSLYRLAKKICQENIPGNFVECGTAAGGTTALIASVIKKHTKQVRWVYAFDSFEGMPPPTSDDTHNGVDAESTGWGTGTCAAPEESVRNLCIKLGVSDIVKTVKGYFQDTLPKMRDKTGMIALLHMDGDWYDSTMTIFDNLYDRVLNDGFIQIDDYGYWEGCRKAVEDFEKKRGIKFSLNQIDSTGVWTQKPDKFQVNPAVSQSFFEQFKSDDIISSGVVSQMSVNERFQLYYLINKLLPVKASKMRFVEIGSFSGASMMLSINAFRRLNKEFMGYAVEPGGTEQFYQVLKMFPANIKHLRLFSHEAAVQLNNEFSRDGILPELIFVDGDHTYEGIYNDITNYYPLLAPGGIMLFHDYLPPLDDINREAIFFHHAGNETGTRRACEELMENTYKAELIDIPLLYPDDPTQTQAHLPLIPGVFSTIRAYRKH